MINSTHPHHPESHNIHAGTRASSAGESHHWRASRQGILAQAFTNICLVAGLARLRKRDDPPKHQTGDMDEMIPQRRTTGRQCPSSACGVRLPGHLPQSGSMMMVAFSGTAVEFDRTRARSKSRTNFSSPPFLLAIGRRLRAAPPRRGGKALPST